MNKKKPTLYIIEPKTNIILKSKISISNLTEIDVLEIRLNRFLSFLFQNI